MCAVLLVLASLLCNNNGYAIAQGQSDLVKEECHTFASNSNYMGKEIQPHFDPSKFASLQISSNGGEHVDGSNKKVYSNFVSFDVKLNFNTSTKYIGDTSIKVEKDYTDWNDMDKANSYKYGNKDTDTEQYIAYGCISAIRKNGDGTVVKYAPIFSKGNTELKGMAYNVDGDYTIYVFFCTSKNGKDKQQHILSWSFSIRTKIFLKDKTTGYDIKDSGISPKSVYVDFANRQGVTVECNKNGESITQISDKYLIDVNGENYDRYTFTVKNNGFIAEIFSFIIDSRNPSDMVYFANLQKQIGPYSYLAEGYFFMDWQDTVENPANVTYKYYDYDSAYQNEDNEWVMPDPEVVKYVKETKLDKVGLYYVTAKIRQSTVDYCIEVTEYDTPSYNYGNLYQKRFNNFKTKWIQVYDRINSRYLCFDMTEGRRAYEAAMTIENSSVKESGGKFYYCNKFYNDRIDLTMAMNENAFKNINTIYYDPIYYSDSDESLRTFSSAAFDNTAYLDDSFQFIQNHYSEVNEVTAKNTDTEITYNIPFFTPIGDLDIPDGEYLITETDYYGQRIEYTVYRDLTSPSVTIKGNDETICCEDGMRYEFSDSFEIIELDDKYDDYCVIRIEKPNHTLAYYYKNEMKGIVFADKGEYTLVSYDRNNNTIETKILVQ